MLMMRDGRAEMQGVAGAFDTATVEFPGKVLSATPFLRGFSVSYGEFGHLPIVDHHVAQVGVHFTSITVVAPGNAVEVVCEVQLWDENQDDQMGGAVDFTVIAEVLDVKEEVKPSAIEGSI